MRASQQAASSAAQRMQDDRQPASIESSRRLGLRAARCFLLHVLGISTMVQLKRFLLVKVYL